MKIYIKLLTSFLVILAACSPQNSEIDTVSDRDAMLVGQAIKFEPTQTSAQFRKRIFEALENYENPETDRNMRSYYMQLLTFAGREDIGFEDKVLGHQQYVCVQDKNVSSKSISEGLPSDIIPLDIIKAHNVIIINEDHSYPRDRAFIVSLLRQLKSEGFTHYAAETLSHNMIKPELTYTDANEGYYLNEPIFGRLVTEVKQLGFDLIPYEIEHTGPPNTDLSFQDRINLRENAQSDNLIKAVLGSRPDTKIIIHVGHAHVAEKPIPNHSGEGSTKWMAALLKEKTGLNPLTISQTLCASPTENMIFTTAVKSLEGENEPLLTDYVVGHPKLKFNKSRPTWRRDIGDVDVSIPIAFLGAEEPIIIEARQPDEPDWAVPTERVLLRPDEKDISLLLPPGTYRLEAFTKSERLGESIKLDVP